MPKTKYIEKNFNQSSLTTINKANEIIDEYNMAGLSLTLRQLYYQFVARDLIENCMSEYKRIGSIISQARLAGLIDWTAIEDRTRNIRSNSYWDNPGEILKTAAESFKLDHWEGQDNRIEVWIEKEALIGVIGSICSQLDISYFACKGYVSLSEMWAAGQRFMNYYKNAQAPLIIHLGDHDPSGIDMTRDILDRASLFSHGSMTIKRIALNMNQIEEYKPPPNFAKSSDSRFRDYYKKYGKNSWELDALDPKILQAEIRKVVVKYRNQEKYQNIKKLEYKYKKTLAKVADNWEKI